jgi:hypothetical protein
MNLYRVALIVVVLIAAAPLMATAATTVNLSTSGGVAFPAGNPSLQPITSASNSLIATVTIDGAKSGSTWNLAIRGASSNFVGPSGTPIPVSNVRWSASATVLDGKGTASVSSGQNLSTSNVVVVSGLEGSKSPFIVQVIFTLTITNSWTYDVDTYLQNLVLTATAN